MGAGAAAVVMVSSFRVSIGSLPLLFSPLFDEESGEGENVKGEGLCVVMISSGLSMMMVNKLLWSCTLSVTYCLQLDVVVSPTSLPS